MISQVGGRINRHGQRPCNDGQSTHTPTRSQTNGGHRTHRMANYKRLLDCNRLENRFSIIHQFLDGDFFGVGSGFAVAPKIRGNQTVAMHIFGKTSKTKSGV